MIDRAQAARERQVHAIRNALADGEPRRRVERGAVCWLYGSTNDGRELEGIHAERLFHDFADFRRQRARDRLRRARREDVGLRLRRVLLGAQLRRDVLGAGPGAAHVAEQQRQHVGRGQRRIGAQRRPQLIGRPGEADR